MDKKATDIVSYLTIIGWLIAYLAGDKENCKFHLNQGLVISLGYIIVGVLKFIPIIRYLAGIAGLVLFVFAIMGIVSAANGEEKPLPVIGEIQILK